MKIAYIANARMPTEKAHGLQIMHMCRAFSQIGHDVTLIIPSRKNWIEKSIWEFYGLEPCFKVIRVPIIDFIVWDRWLGNLALWLETFWFGLAARRVIEDLQPDAVYSRDPFSSSWCPRWVPHVFEAHTFPNRVLWFYRWLWKKCDRIVTVTDGLKKMFLEQGVDESRLRTAADAVDLEAFTVKESKAETRKKLNLPSDKFLVVYAGHLYPYKGIPDLIEACKWLDDGIRVVIVGGRDEDLTRTKEKAESNGLKNVIFIGRVPHKEVPRYLHAADLAVMPYTRESHHVEYYSSPLKLFEYLAAGRAILSTDLPSIREVLDDKTAEYVKPEDPKALSDRMNLLIKRPERIAELEAHSIRLSKLYTWKNRAVAVLAALPKAEWNLTFYRKYRLEIHLSLLALAVRLLYVVFFPQQRIIGGDSVYYLALADWLRGARPYSPTEMSSYFPLIYPYLLSGIRTFFGTDLLWIRVIQAFMSAATVFMMMLIARRWSKPYTSWITGLIGAFYVPMILEAGILYTETTYTLALTAAVFFFGWALENSSSKRAFVAGMAFALAGSVREIGFYMGAGLMTIFAVLKPKRIRFALVFMIPILFVIGTVAVHNRIFAANNGQTKGAPLIAKSYEKQLTNPLFIRNALSPSRLILYPVTAWRFFRYPFRLNDISFNEVSMKRAILKLDWKTIGENWASFADKGFLMLFHWFILLMAVVGLSRGVLAREQKLIFCTLITIAFFTIALQSVGNNDTWESMYEPLARYRFPVEPLIIILAAAGIERLSQTTNEHAKALTSSDKTL
jgi:glycosyltransferase involved in cell wall biosynthesis